MPELCDAASPRGPRPETVAACLELPACSGGYRPRLKWPAGWGGGGALAVSGGATRPPLATCADGGACYVPGGVLAPFPEGDAPRRVPTFQFSLLRRCSYTSIIQNSPWYDQPTRQASRRAHATQTITCHYTVNREKEQEPKDSYSSFLTRESMRRRRAAGGAC